MKRKPKEYNQFKKDICQVGIGCIGPLDADHVKTLGSGGKNTENNIMTLCRYHHGEKGQKGLLHMSEKYWKVKSWLLSHGWYFCSTRLKWVHDG